MKKINQFIGGDSNMFILVLLLSLIIGTQIIKHYNKFSIEFWETVGGIVFVAIASSITVIFVLRLFVLLTKKKPH